jgi:hypothetical protein
LVVVADLITLVVSLIVGAGLIWYAFRIEPHWCSKDGLRFTCRLQPLTTDLANDGLHVDMRGTIDKSGLVLTPRGLRGSKMGGVYRMVAASPEPPKGKAVYLVTTAGRQFTLRVPANSRCVAPLDELAAPGSVTRPERSPGTRPEDPPTDPG